MSLQRDDIRCDDCQGDVDDSAVYESSAGGILRTALIYFVLSEFSVIVFMAIALIAVRSCR